jgi:hypothetical protein
MGVFSPVLDYVVATQFRDERMGWKLNEHATERMLAEFGYDKTDLPDKGRLVEI